jgi:outer membrane protein OmpA-like peptidoglycan-associated protein
MIFGMLNAAWVLWSTPVYSQSATSPFVIRLVNGSGDTLIYTRTPTSYRFGVAMSAMMQAHYGTLITPINVQYTCNGFYVLDPGGIGNGGGAFGLIAEYQPIGSVWGASIRANLVDYRSTLSETPFPAEPGFTKDFLGRTIVSSIRANYLSVQPRARMILSEQSGLHLLGGLDLDISTGSSMTRSVVQQTLDRAEVIRSVDFDVNPIRYGVALGAGVDIIGGVLGRLRMILSPSLTVHVGSPMYTAYKSSWSSVYAQASFSIKFSPDEVGEETRPGVPSKLESIPVVASVSGRSDGRSEQQADKSAISIGMLLAPTTKEPEPIAEAVKKTQESSAGTTPDNPTEEQPDAEPVRIAFTGRLEVNNAEVFSTYSTPMDTAIGPRLRGYLEALSDYMKTNPSYLLRIVGHSDNFGGSPAETQRISDERALQIVRFMMKSGISRDRLLASGMGARSPVASNRTPQGRASNRRVEITIIER